MSGDRHHRPELRALAREMAELGWSWSFTGSGHVRWEHPGVRHPVFTSSTPRCGMMKQERGKLMRAMKQAGLAQ